MKESKDLSSVIAKGADKPIRKWLTILGILLLIGGGYYFYKLKNPADDGSPKYQTTELERGDISIQVSATGNLAPTNQVTVGSELSGTAAEVYVDNNDQVKKGQPLAKLDTSKLTQTANSSKASLLAAEASVTQAEATVVEAEAAHARNQKLHDLSGGKTPSQADMDTSLATVNRAKADLESAKASVSVAEATLKNNERDLSKALIRSPIDGVVLTRSLEPGQTVAASLSAPELFILAEDLRKMDLVVAVAEADIGRLAENQPATFTVDAWPTRVFKATTNKVYFGSSTTNNVVTYSVELEVTNDDLSLRPGMTATADISVAKKDDVLLVPNSALRFDPGAAKQAENKTEEKKTLVESLAPPKRARGSSSGTKQNRKESSGTRKPQTEGTIYTLRDGQPVALHVTIGLTDGRNTEVSGEGLTEGMPIILNVIHPAAHE
ncbi:MAG: efflux RND transporter periplasmic adaptor subunit [Luteolibacter sp.]